jgi:LacI family transcriptional regulator
MAVLLKQLAAASGYSINTVSRALRDKADVSPQTKEKIRALASELGYVNNSVAKSLITGKTNIIGVISADSSNPFFAEVIMGIENAARASGYHILLTNTEESPEREREAVNVLIGKQVDGLLLMPVLQQNNNSEYLKSLNVPYIIVGRWLPGLEEHSVMSDEYEKAKQVVLYFLKNGHKDILHLAGPPCVSSSVDRLRGYRDAHTETHTPIQEDLIVETKGHLEDGYREVSSLIRNERNISAIFAFNDLVAVGALRALRESGIKVPKEVEVIGFDDLNFSKFLHFSLSSVSIAKKTMGNLAFRTLLGHIENPEAPYGKKIVESRIVYRETTLEQEP